jgi:thymidylate synthase (FAD)
MTADNEEQWLSELRSAPAATFRATSPELEALLYRATPILDHGFVRVVDYMGNDDAVVQGARVSYGKGTRHSSDSRSLIRYLMRHHHTTPFELAELKLHVRAPIFVARQWFRHRTASINEYSARYSVLEREFYTPTMGSIAAQSESNKQGRGAKLDVGEAHEAIEVFKHDAARCYDNYLMLLNENEDGRPIQADRAGVSRELARINLPVSVYTQFYWKVNLWNLLRFLQLRADPHAQYEIRVYAEAILAIVGKWVPLVHEAFQDFVIGGADLSKQALAMLRDALDGKRDLAPSNYGLSRREVQEVVGLLPQLAPYIRGVE